MIALFFSIGKLNASWQAQASRPHYAALRRAIGALQD